MAEKDNIPDETRHNDAGNQPVDTPPTSAASASEVSRQLEQYRNNSAGNNPAERRDEQFRNCTVTNADGSISLRFDSPELSSYFGSLARQTGEAKLASGDQPAGKEKKAEKLDVIPLEAGTRQAKDDFLHAMKDRLGPGDYAKLEQKLNQMDQRILHNNVEGKNGKIDQQAELKKTYEALTKLTDGKAEQLKDEKGRQVFDKGDVDRMLKDAVSRLADPERAFNQGQKNTCALEAAGRQEAAISPSTYANRLQQVARTGRFTAEKPGGGLQVCEVDRASLRADQEAQQDHWGGGKSRGLAGQVQNIAMAQLNLDLRSGDPGRFVYKQDVNPSGQGSTGEHVIDRGVNRTGNTEIANNPMVNANSLGRMKQSAFGGRFSDTFGRDTTIINENAFGHVANATGVGSGEALGKHLQAMESKGWKYSTLGVHTQNWNESLGQGGAGGWHAVSASMGEGGKINVHNNWGGVANFSNRDGKEVLGWMNAPDKAPASDREREDHVFDPDGRTREKDPLRDAEKEREKKEEPKEQPKDKPREEERKKDPDPQQAWQDALAAQHREASALVDNLQSQLNSLPQNDARRNFVKSQLAAAQSIADRTGMISSLF